MNTSWYRIASGNACWYAELSPAEAEGYRRDGYAVTAALPPDEAGVRACSTGEEDA